MTIIQPNKYKDIKKLGIILSVILTAFFFSAVALYLHTVDLRHDVLQARVGLEELAVRNAELKSQYYTLVDAENLLGLAKENGFIQDRNPQWAFVSPF